MSGSRQSLPKPASTASRGAPAAHFSGSLQQDISNSNKTRSPRGMASHQQGSVQSRKMTSVSSSGSQSGGRSNSAKLAQNSVQSVHPMHHQQALAAQMQQFQARQQAGQNGRPAMARSLAIGSNTIAGQMQASAGHPLKRSRSSSMNSREPESKRSKAGPGGLSKAQHNQGNTHRSIPQSPTSSRSRSRNPTSKVTGYTEQQGSNSATNSMRQNSGTVGTTTATFSVGSRQRVQNVKARQNQPRQQTPRVSAPSTLPLTMDGIPVPSDIKVTSLQGRIFGHEIQCMMHAFGESRACSRDTLELVEDSVRDTVRRVAALAVDLAVEESFVSSMQSSSSRKSVVLEARHVAHVLRNDSRAMYRLNQTLKHVVDHGPQPDANEVSQCLKVLFTPDLSPWELIAQLSSVPGETDQDAEIQANRDRSSMNDPSRFCTWRAYHLFRVNHSVMHANQFAEYVKCRQTNLVTGTSRNQAQNLKDHRRLTLLQKWLDLSSPNLDIGIPALCALGHIAWEAIGILTQTALVQKYFDELSNGLGDPRSVGWSFARHNLAALGHGIATAIMLPMSDTQLVHLRQEVEQLPFVMTATPDRWRGLRQGSKCLLPKDIKEALRRREDASRNTILNVMRGCV